MPIRFEKNLDKLCTYVHNAGMRPKKMRWIECEPGERCFRPKDFSKSNGQGVCLTMDEFEAVRLADFEGLEQEEIAAQMRVHRSTISRILNSARKKIADALVNLKAIKIEGGCCTIGGGNHGRRKKSG